jgi:hypothetical protein
MNYAGTSALIQFAHTEPARLPQVGPISQDQLRGCLPDHINRTSLAVDRDPASQGQGLVAAATQLLKLLSPN